MHRIVILAACVAASVVQAVPTTSQSRRASGDYNYDRCDHVKGPDHWSAEFCGARHNVGAHGVLELSKTRQSPIDVCNAKDHSGVTSSVLQPSSGYNMTKTYKFKMDGQAYIDASDDGLTLTAGMLAQINRPAINHDGTFTWNLAQAHFHWGRGKDEGSEHYIEGKRYPLELHFVHVNSKYADINAALASGEEDALLVVGQMFKVGSGESAELAAMGSKLSSDRRAAHGGVDVNMKLGKLMDPSAGFYTYPGSLTTPTCNPVVTWVVLASELPIAETTLNKFLNIKKGNNTVSEFGNYRPLQAHNGRTVYKTAGITSVACKNASDVEPTFECPVEEEASGAVSTVASLTGSFMAMAVAILAVFAY